MRIRSLALLLSSVVVAAAPARAEDAPAPSGKDAASFTCPEDMVAIPGGSFVLDGKKVMVEDFCIDKTEVTAWMYCECVRRELCDRSGVDDGSAWATYPRCDEAPMNYVTWHQALTYCQARHHRLPTDAEWEWAARGGPAANKYPWGGAEPTTQACWSGPSKPGTPAPRLKRPCAVLDHPEDVTPQGAVGMAGGVFEWTATAKGKERFVRGGSWGSSKPSHLEVTSRSLVEARHQSHLIGFRCADKPQAQR